MKSYFLINIFVFGFAAMAIMLTGSLYPDRSPDENGRLRVGYTSFVVQDPERPTVPLKIDVWYPARGRTGPNMIYNLDIAEEVDELLAGLNSKIANKIRKRFSQVIYDHEPQMGMKYKTANRVRRDVLASKRGPFPLIVWGPGAFLEAHSNMRVIETLASHGFVVAGVNFTSNGTRDYIADLFGTECPLAEWGQEPPCFQYNRVLREASATESMRFAISAMIEKNTNDELLQGIMDIDRIGLYGYSFGTSTSQYLAGGANLSQVCPEPGCDDIEKETRVKAMVLADPAELPTVDHLSEVTIPTLILSGSKNSDRIGQVPGTLSFDLMTNASPRYNVIFGDNVNHESFYESCLQTGSAALASMAQDASIDPYDLDNVFTPPNADAHWASFLYNVDLAGFDAWGARLACPELPGFQATAPELGLIEPLVSPDEVNRLHTLYTIAFFVSELGDGRFDAFLSPDYASQEPNIMEVQVRH